MNALAFSSSPRPRANSTALLQAFEQGLTSAGGRLETIDVNACGLKACRGCLRCNLIKRCAIRGDDWGEISEKILAADVLVFAAPVYFHHVPSTLKAVIDRFRSFMHIRLTDAGLVHTPWQQWSKHFVMLLSMGAPAGSDARPIIELFEYMAGVLGQGNRLSVVAAGGLALAGQVTMDAVQLREAYEKLGLDPGRAEADAERNRGFLEATRELGRTLA